MPTRLIRDAILTSGRVASLSWEEEVFYRRLMSVADDYGLYDARPPILRSALYPLQLDKMSECNIQRCLSACEAAGLILLYSHAGKPYLMILGFGQQGKTSPKWPLPDGYEVQKVSDKKYELRQLVTVRNDSPQPVTYANANAYSDTKTDADANANKQENNAEGNTTVVCSSPPAAPVLPASSFPAGDRLNDVRGMHCADNHADLGASPGATRFMHACLEINPSWFRTSPTAIEQAAALEAYRSAQGRVTPRDMEMLRAYYASGLTHDRNKKAFWRPDSRKKFWECFGDVLTHADRWAKETHWKPAGARKKLKPEPAPQQPEGPLVDTDTAAAEIRALREEMGIGGEE